MISTFEEDDRESASDELLKLGDAFCLDVLDFCQKLVIDPCRIATLKVLAAIGSVRLFQAMIDQSFVIIAVDAVAVGETDIMILFAGRYGRPSPGWNGVDYDALMANVIVPRCKSVFSS